MTKGKMATFFMQARTLFCRCFILLGLVCLRLVYLFDDLSDARVDLFVCLNLFCRVDEENVCSAGYMKRVFLLSPAFSDSSF